MAICFACDRKVGKPATAVMTTDGQVVVVGQECFKNIGKGVTWQPPKGGPKLQRIPGVSYRKVKP